MIRYKDPPVDTAPTELEQENAELRADNDHLRTALRKLKSNLANVQVRARQLDSLVERILEEAQE